jgi:hypothetical protein
VPQVSVGFVAPVAVAIRWEALTRKEFLGYLEGQRDASLSAVPWQARHGMVIAWHALFTLPFLLLSPVVVVVLQIYVLLVLP